MINLSQVHHTHESQAAVNLTKIVSTLAMQQQVEQTIKDTLAKEFEQSHAKMNQNWNYLLKNWGESMEEAAKLREAAINQKEISLDIDGLKDKFNVTKTTIHNWIKRGWIKGKKVGKARFFSQADIDELIKFSGINLGD